MQDKKQTQNNPPFQLNTPNKDNQLQICDSNKEKKKSKLIWRKTKTQVPLLLNYSYIFKISESLIINERALKQPYTCRQSFMASVFYFKSIQSLSINDQYVTLHLKQVQKNQFPICYYTERFKSFGDQDFYQLAMTLEMLDLEFKKKVINPQVYHEQQKERKQLKQKLTEVLESNKGKKIMIFYSEPTGDHVTMNRIVLSNQLLNTLGYKVDNLTRDFLRYRHVFFQIFDTTFYNQVVKKGHKRLQMMKQNKNEVRNTVQNQGKIHTPSNQQKFYDYIFRVRQDQKGLFQEKIQAEIIFSKPYHHLSVYEIAEIDENNIVLKSPKKQLKNNETFDEYEQKLILQQTKTLEGLQHNLQLP